VVVEVDVLAGGRRRWPARVRDARSSEYGEHGACKGRRAVCARASAHLFVRRLQPVVDRPQTGP
jgi:hypothetical protein